MKLDVKNLAFGAVGETDDFDLSLEKYQISEDIVTTGLKGEIKLTRLDDSILAEVNGHTIIKSNCDRCLDDYDLEVSFEFSREYFLGGYRENVEDLLVSKHFEVDIEEPMREEILLALPIRKLCKDECRGICPHCGANLNAKECKCGKS